MACDSPYYVDNPLSNRIGEPSKIPVGCGRCYECQRTRASQWAFRLSQEDLVSNFSMFVTLTYDDWSLPRSDRNLPTLVKKDLQNFFKRYRKLHPEGTIIKYYAVGEYGTNNWRPHYHIILFNSHNNDVELLEKAWSLKNKLIGYIDVGNVSGASIAYTTKYLSKSSRIPRFLGDDRLKEFSLMSQKLGANYVNSETKMYHRNGMINYVVNPSGVKIPLPRYYKNKFFDKSQQSELKLLAQINAQQRERDFIHKAVRLYGPTVNLERYAFAKIQNHHRKLTQGDKNRKI